MHKNLILDKSRLQYDERENYTARKLSYRLEIDGLRALAVVAVIVNHFQKDILPSGYLGVDIFFVISGYVITSSLSWRDSRNFSEFIVSFYTRRIRRLVPALSVFILVASILICMLNSDPGSSLSVGQNALFGLSNISLYNTSVDYFSQSTELNPFTHTWSLGVEEQFYLVFPALVWFSGFGRKTDQGANNLTWILGILTFVSLIAFILLYDVNQPAAYFLMPFRFWELAVGCLVFIGMQQHSRVVNLLYDLPSMAILIGIIGVLFMPLSAALPATIAIVILSGLLIICLRQGDVAYQVLTQDKIVYIGLVSYSLYLWHWGVLSISRWTIGVHWWTLPFQTLGMILLADFSYKYIETPNRKSLLGIKSFFLLVLQAVFFFSALVFTSGKAGNSIYLGRFRSSPVNESLVAPYSISGFSGWKGDACVLSDDSQIGKKIKIEDCTLGSFESSKRRILVVGNSYSASFVQAFDDLVKKDRYAITITSSWGASPVKEVDNKDYWKEIARWQKANTYYWDRVFPDLVSRLKSGDIVFLINDMSQFSPVRESRISRKMLRQLKQGLTILSDNLAHRNISLYVLNSLPLVREANCSPVAATQQWFQPFGAPCHIPNRSASIERSRPLESVLIYLESSKKIKVVDVFDLFCPDSYCSYESKSGYYLYRDSAHPSVAAARSASRRIREKILKL